MNDGFLPAAFRGAATGDGVRPDFCLVTGDAYVDHPSFGAAIIARVLERAGYRVCVIAQPHWKSAEGFKAFGRPRLAFLVTAGNLDSMVNHYTAAKRARSTDAYSPGGRAGLRPDRASIVYVNKIREAYARMPVILGGVEASLRRFAHYDYWSDRVRRSLLVDSGADMLVYGMGEQAILEIARQLQIGAPIGEITSVAGTCWLAKSAPDGALELPPFDEAASDKRKYAIMHRMAEAEQDPIRGRRLFQVHPGAVLVQNPPAPPLSGKRLDEIYALPYMRAAHPVCKEPVPALEEVSFSVTSSRGCFGGCSFCALTFHQGRMVSGRSHDSILSEARAFVGQPGFKGYIHDVGGPTANFRAPACKKQIDHGTCGHRDCLYPSVCPSMDVTHRDYLELLRKLRELPGVKKVFIRSGLRMDYLMADKSSALRTICEHHVSGQLKVAPEHVSQRVLDAMHKPGPEVFERFMQRFRDVNAALGKEQYIVPYFMSSHPGSDLNAAIELALFLRKHAMRVEQVQDFYPTPGTRSTCMFYTGLDPQTMQQVYVPRTPQEKAMQRALLQPHRVENRPMIIKALKTADRDDLIGVILGGAPRPRAQDAQPGRGAKSARPGKGGGAHRGKGAKPEAHGRRKQPKGANKRKPR